MQDLAKVRFHLIGGKKDEGGCLHNAFRPTFLHLDGLRKYDVDKRHLRMRPEISGQFTFLSIYPLAIFKINSSDCCIRFVNILQFNTYC